MKRISKTNQNAIHAPPVTNPPTSEPSLRRSLVGLDNEDSYSKLNVQFDEIESSSGLSNRKTLKKSYSAFVLGSENRDRNLPQKSNSFSFFKRKDRDVHLNRDKFLMADNIKRNKSIKGLLSKSEKSSYTSPSISKNHGQTISTSINDEIQSIHSYKSTKSEKKIVRKTSLLSKLAKRYSLTELDRRKLRYSPSITSSNVNSINSNANSFNISKKSSMDSGECNSTQESLVTDSFINLETAPKRQNYPIIRRLTSSTSSQKLQALFRSSSLKGESSSRDVVEEQILGEIFPQNYDELIFKVKSLANAHSTAYSVLETTGRGGGSDEIYVENIDSMELSPFNPFLKESTIKKAKPTDGDVRRIVDLYSFQPPAPPRNVYDDRVFSTLERNGGDQNSFNESDSTLHKMYNNRGFSTLEKKSCDQNHFNESDSTPRNMYDNRGFSTLERNGGDQNYFNESKKSLIKEPIQSSPPLPPDTASKETPSKLISFRRSLQSLKSLIKRRSTPNISQPPQTENFNDLTTMNTSYIKVGLVVESLIVNTERRNFKEDEGLEDFILCPIPKVSSPVIDESDVQVEEEGPCSTREYGNFARVSMIKFEMESLMKGFNDSPGLDLSLKFD